MYLAGSRLVLQNCTKIGGRPYLKLTLFLVENGWGRLHSSLVRWRRTSDMDCTELQCGTVRVRQVEPEVNVPCRLSKIGVRPDLKLTLFLAENGGIRDQFALHCALRS